MLGHEPTDMADGPRTWLMRILSDAWVPRVLVANSTDVGGVRSAGQCEARQRRRDSGGVRSSAKFTLPPQTLIGGCNRRPLFSEPKMGHNRPNPKVGNKWETIGFAYAGPYAGPT